MRFIASAWNWWCEICADAFFLLKRFFLALINITFGPKTSRVLFIGEQEFGWVTVGGFRVKYLITCGIKMVSLEEFEAGRMLEPGATNRFVIAWHDQVFIPKCRERGFYFRIMRTGHHLGTHLCGLFTQDGKQYLGFDPSCIDLIQEILKIPFRHNGCIPMFASLKVIEDAQVITENFNMIKMPTRQQILESPEYREYEESFAAALVHRRFQLERELINVQVNSDHNSKFLKVRTQLVGQAVEISWSTGCVPEADVLLRGYRNDKGFSDGNNGVCVIESRTNGKTSQHLEAGKDYFFTFILSENVGGAYQFRDTLRFSIRVPTTQEMTRVERVLEKVLHSAPVDPRRAKIDQALQELNSFVELDEALTRWERQMIRQYELSDYSPEEKAEKIQRLQLTVSHLRVNE